MLKGPNLVSTLVAALESNTVAPAVTENNVVYHIQIAEDNMVNQKLAVKILESTATMSISSRMVSSRSTTLSPRASATSHMI